jgi:hypothetical protein
MIELSDTWEDADVIQTAKEALNPMVLRSEIGYAQLFSTS